MNEGQLWQSLFLKMSQLFILFFLAENAYPCLILSSRREKYQIPSPNLLKFRPSSPARPPRSEEGSSARPVRGQIFSVYLLIGS